YHDGVYVLVSSQDGAIVTATNLVTPGTFAIQTLTNAKPRAVEFGAGRFVVASEGGAMLSSTNGYDWESHGASGPYVSLAYGDGRFVAVGSRTSAVSTNGTDWVTSQELPLFIQDVVHGNGIFLASGSRTNAVSADGISWEPYVLPSGNGFYAVGFGDGKFIGIQITTSTDDNVLISYDGRNWSSHGRVGVIRSSRIAWGNGYFVTVAAQARAYSADGFSWTVMTANQPGSSVEFVNGRFVAPAFKSLFESDPVVRVTLDSDELRVDSVAGRAIQIEAVDALTDTWQPLGPASQANVSGEVFVKLPRGAGQRFFRAVLRDDVE
ncbi:MAG TPA: hypothetical protein VF773_13540, partial [Verrucomicrobiae bacterium]